jgi:hypothetical protein
VGVRAYDGDRGVSGLRTPTVVVAEEEP